MILLKYPAKSAAIEALVEQLKEFSLAFKAVEDPSLGLPVLQEGKTIVTGIENIKVYLEQLTLEIYESRNAAC